MQQARVPHQQVGDRPTQTVSCPAGGRDRGFRGRAHSTRDVYVCSKMEYIPSRRKMLLACSASICLTAGCLTWDSPPDIPRDSQILDERTTIDQGAYQAWSLSERISSASVPSQDRVYLFSYEFVVEEGPEIMVATTTSDQLERRAEIGDYRVWQSTRTTSQQGALSKQLSKEFLSVLVADNQSLDSETSEQARDSATVRIQAYLSSLK